MSWGWADVGLTLAPRLLAFLLWKSVSQTQLGKRGAAASTAVSTGSSPMSPSLQLIEEIGFKLSHSGALGLLSREQALRLEGQMFWVSVMVNLLLTQR